MAWTKGKTLKSRKPFKTWSKNPRKVQTVRTHNPAQGMHGGTVIYRDHVKSMGVPKGEAHFGDDLVSRYHPLPKSLAKKIHAYHEIPDHQLPPMIADFQQASLIKRPGHIQHVQASHFLPKWNCMTLLAGELIQIHMMFSGVKFFFIEEDNIYHTIRRSCLYKPDKARSILRSENYESILWIEKLTVPKKE